jgi:hypothetical protein
VKETLLNKDLLQRGISASWLSIEGTLVQEGEELPQSGNLSPVLTQYYSAATSAILGDSDEVVKVRSLDPMQSEGMCDLMQMILDDIANNSKISSLLPFFVSFARTGMQKHSDNKVLITRLLCFLHALFSNRHLNFSPKPYVSAEDNVLPPLTLTTSHYCSSATWSPPCSPASSPTARAGRRTAAR